MPSLSVRVCPRAGRVRSYEGKKALGPLAGPRLRSQGSESGRKECNLKRQLGGLERRQFRDGHQHISLDDRGTETLRMRPPGANGQLGPHTQDS